MAALRSWLLANGPSPLCPCKSNSCRTCPGNKFKTRISNGRRVAPFQENSSIFFAPQKTRANVLDVSARAWAYKSTFSFQNPDDQQTLVLYTMRQFFWTQMTRTTVLDVTPGPNSTCKRTATSWCAVVSRATCALWYCRDWNGRPPP